MKYFCISIFLLTSFTTYCQSTEKLGTVDCSSRYLDSAYIVERLADTGITEFCKELYFNPKNAGDNLSTSIVLDTIENSIDFKRLPFYFYCITNTLPYTDGAYAEGIGYFAHKLFKERTLFFINVFICTNKMRRKELSLWAEAIAGEIFIAGVGEGKQSLEKLKKDIAVETATFSSLKKKVAQMILENIENEFETIVEANLEPIKGK